MTERRSIAGDARESPRRSLVAAIGWMRGFSSAAGALLLGLGLATAPVLADTIVATPAAEIEIDVPDPANPGHTMKVILGQLVGRLGTDALQQRVVIGFRKTYAGPLCCDSLHFVNVVLSDPAPPKWKGEDGKVHEIGAGNAYVDPLSGGNIPPNQANANPVADRVPWYDGERAARKASTTGDFASGEQKEYDLDDVNVGAGFDWRTDPVLDLIFADAPTLTAGLEFATLLVCVKGKVLCPIAGITWGRSAANANHIDSVFDGDSLPAGLGVDAVTAALARSGFTDYRMRAPPCCPAPDSRIPLPGTVPLVALALIALAGARHRRGTPTPTS